ncbi:TauD/TfdA family dioxygenase [Chitinophagaceae bacterium MMS25-I14]
MILQQSKLTNSFGLVLEPGYSSDPMELDLNEVADLFKTHRTLYFKGWDFDVEKFRAFSGRLSGNFSSYEGGGFRFKELDREFVSPDKTIMTTTGHTQGFSIPLHGEMHYIGTPPPLIWFYCKTPGGNTGQTTICDGYELANRLSDNVKKFFNGRQIKYSRFLGDGSWQSSFLTDDPEKAMEICRQQKVSYQYDAEKKEMITDFHVSPFTERGYVSGSKFINNLLNIVSVEWAFESGWVKENFSSDFGARCPMIVRMDDGSRIPGDILDEIRECAEACTINVEWEAGEVLMIDNLSVMHGRRESRNPAREIFVRMGDAGF